MRALPHLGRIFAIVTLLGGTLAGAQQPVDLDRILSQVEANSEQYTGSVPSFICREHIVSEERHKGKIKRQTTVDAVFSVRRSTASANTLEESRDVTTVDGKPATNRKIAMPLSFSGGFSGALSKFLSRSHRPCFTYAADASVPSSAVATAFIFAAKPSITDTPACSSIQPGTTGKFTVDTASMQVTHIERTVQTSVGNDPTVLGTAEVDYAPVALGGKSFWLPVTITAFTTETPKTDSVHFTASYSDYHRFAATATILPTDK